jgi:ketosteroid isomerase-like protein
MRWFRILSLIPVLALSSSGPSQEGAGKGGALEKQLWEIDQQWLDAATNKKLDFLKQLWTDEFFEIIPGGRPVSKTELLDALSKMNWKPGEGVFPDNFRLQAVYPGLAVATDRTVSKSTDANGQSVSREMRVVRAFVRQNGQWKVAAAALVATDTAAFSPALGEETGGETSPSLLPLERQLAGIDEKWMDAARTDKLDYLKQLFTDQWVEIVPWVPTTLTKAETLQRLAQANFKPGQGVFPDEFKLRAVYGSNIAIATDRRTRKGTDSNGREFTQPHRTLLIFVKEKGQWKSAGGALVPIVSP